MLQDLRLGGGNQTVATDALFAGLGAFDSSSGVMFTKGDEIQRAHWHTYIFKVLYIVTLCSRYTEALTSENFCRVVAALQEATPDATELPNEVLRWEWTRLTRTHTYAEACMLICTLLCTYGRPDR
jgi:hypothetical protein